MKRALPWLLTLALLGAGLAQEPGTPPADGGDGSAVGATSDTSTNTSTDTAGDSAGQAPDDQPAGEATPADGTSSADTPPPDAAPDEGPVNGGEVELTRKGNDGKERTIRIVKTGDDASGIFAICSPPEDAPEGTPTEFVASDTGAGGVQVTVDKNLIQAPLALISKQPGGDGHIEMSTGTASYIPDEQIDPTARDRLTSCGVKDAATVTPGSVLVTQGRTSLKGARLVYDEKDGVARIDGPVNFDRTQASGDPLTGSAQRIEVSVDEEKTTLVGGVELKQGSRTSRAERVDYDDAANVAVLHGSADAPAETRTPTEVLRAQTIRYDLDSGEAVVEAPGNTITGSFQDSDAADGDAAQGSSLGP